MLGESGVGTGIPVLIPFLEHQASLPKPHQAKHKMAWPDPEISRGLSQALSAVTQPELRLLIQTILIKQMNGEPYYGRFCHRLRCNKKCRFTH